MAGVWNGGNVGLRECVVCAKIRGASPAVGPCVDNLLMIEGHLYIPWAQP